jgi:O-antigen ligase
MHSQVLPHKDKNKFLYYCLLAYTIIFYSQIGGRIPVLGTIRIELLVGSIILILIFLKVNKGTIKIKKNRVSLAATFFLVACFITIPFAYYKTYSFEIFIRLLKFFAIYLMIIFGIQSEKQLKGFIWIYILMIAFIFTESFFYAIQGLHIRYNSGAMRLFGPPGLFGHPNSLGGVTAANLPFLYFLFNYEKSRIRKLLLFALMVIAIRVIMYTNSRTAFIGFISFIPLVWLFSKNKLVVTIVILLSCMLLWQFAPPETKQRFLTLKKTEQYISGQGDNKDAMGYRLLLLKNSFNLFLEFPITGVGIGNFISISGWRYNIWLPTHNLYTQALSETGIVGSLSFMLLIIFIIKNLNEAKKIIYQKKLHETFSSSMLTSVKIFLILRLVVGLFGDDLYDNYWWIAGGLSVVILNIVKYEPFIGVSALPRNRSVVPQKSNGN